MSTVIRSKQLVGRKQGKLTIFASYFSGTGKSYSMLEVAEKARQAGMDVVIGCFPASSGLKLNCWLRSLRYCLAKQSCGMGEWIMKWIWMLV